MREREKKLFILSLIREGERNQKTQMKSNNNNDDKNVTLKRLIFLPLVLNQPFILILMCINIILCTEDNIFDWQISRMTGKTQRQNI